MNKLFTKIAALALGAAMVVGVGVSVGSKSKASAGLAADNDVVFHFKADTFFTASSYGTKSGSASSGTSGTTVSSATYNCTVGNYTSNSSTAVFGTNANSSHKSKLKLNYGSYSWANGIASALGITSSAQCYAAAVSTTGFSKIKEIQVYWNGQNGGVPSAIYALSSSNGTDWTKEAEKTSSISSGSKLSFEYNAESLKYAFVAYWNTSSYTNGGGLKHLELKYIEGAASVGPQVTLSDPTSSKLPAGYAVNSSLEATATGFSGTVTYSWNATSNPDYVDLTKNGNRCTVTSKASNTSTGTVTIEVSATDGTNTKTASKNIEISAVKSVSEAIAAVGTNGVFVHGFVNGYYKTKAGFTRNISEAADLTSSGQAKFYISADGSQADDNSRIEAYNCLDLNKAAFASYPILMTEVVIFGDMTLFQQTTYELNQNCYLVVKEAPSTHTITTTVTNGSYSGATEIGVGSATVTVSANEGYKLPSSITVTGASHTYDSSTGEIVLSGASADVTILVACEEATQYDVNVTATNCTYSPEKPKLYENGELVLTFTANTGYDLPASNPTVTNATFVSWTNGVLTIENATGTVGVTVTATEHVDKVFREYNGALTEGDYIVYDSVSEVAMKNVATSAPRIDVEDVQPSSGAFTNPDSSIVWHLAKDGDYWSFYNASADKYVVSTGSDGKATLSETKTDNALWTVSGTSDYDFLNKVRDTKYLRYNPGYGFATYATGTGSTLTLYKLGFVPKELDSITIVKSPDKTSYVEGDHLNLSGIEVVANWTDGSESTPLTTSDFTTNPSTSDSLEVSDTSVTVSYSVGSIEKTAEFAINVAAFVGKTYNLIDNANKVHVGDKVVIVAAEYDVAMSVTQNQNNRGEAAIQKGTNTVTTTATVQEFTIVAGTTDGTFGFYSGSGYLAAASSSSNNMHTDAEMSANSSFTISVSDGVATITAQGSYTRNIIRYNNSSNIFSCYATGQKGVSLYKLPYSVGDFGRDLLNATKGVCNSSYDGVTDQSSILSPIWASLKIQYNRLDDKSDFVNGTPDESIVVPTTEADIMSMSDSDAIGASLFRYDYCTAKYKLDNFANRTLTLSFDRIIFNPFVNSEGNPTAIIIIVSVIGVSALGGFFFLRKRKEI